jgi:hypothetical protein
MYTFLKSGVIWVGSWDHDDWIAAGTVVVAIFTVVLAVSTILLWLTTRRAAFATDRSLRDLNRAFVFPKRVILQPVAGGGIEVIVTWENSGNTQTVQMRSVVNFQTFPPAVMAGFNYPDVGTNPPVRTLIGPKSEQTMRPVIIPHANVLAVAAGTHRILVYGWVEYDDIFAVDAGTDRHRTEFCAELLVTPNPGGAGFVTADQMHPEHNGSERECGQRFVDAQSRRPRLGGA